ncbi:cobalamin adenosyltransferase [Clostridium carboxidivorans P7]|uniref:Corrinoid adenosyltransferase n=1 Tax=Clostridium carboxidivorans P7 TaxID=536227 RepID=C6PQJ5_9CLOT|nr:cob(I)yrinic acid a,c-diamide adenosyltransferase [Clostridium carboxidivorans]AKN30414.1 cobalamin adenosyltransferase [Clostridium carboxidivorans P7]EET88517.1 ATP/cobalamin adenosyltransferase [Clostridium carboxidivorans P7]EFG86153.1 ATP:cob(I)alamin adenosyltransferase [Clostridium carboxidivorans P7]
MKIYTKTGDKGTTSLVGGDRAEKHDLRVWAYGTIDEVNSSIGVARAYIKEKEFSEILLKIQKTLFEVGAELASLGTDYYKERIKDEDITFLEETIDKLDGLKPSFNGFIVPGGTVESAHLDIARTVVRRAERCISELKNNYEVSKNLMKYTNRLSDGLYAVARYFDYKDIMEKTKENIEKFNQSGKMEDNCHIEEINKTMLNMTVIDRETAKYIAEKCAEKSHEVGVPMVICITDFSGNITLLERMDDSLLASIEIAMKKAYTAAALKSPTHELREASLPTGELYGINNVEKIITFGGGFPLKINGKIIGAIGVSGGTVEQDMKVAQYGLKAFEGVLTNGITK